MTDTGTLTRAGQERQDRAQAALDAYADTLRDPDYTPTYLYRADDERAAQLLSDVVADLMHYCAGRGIPFEEVCAAAERAFAEETAEAAVPARTGGAPDA